jgi:hypothetical protein
MSDSGRVQAIGRRLSKSLLYHYIDGQEGVGHMATDVAPVRINQGQEHGKRAARHVVAARMISALAWAGGTGIAPAPCDCGARGALSRVVQGCLTGP